MITAPETSVRILTRRIDAAVPTTAGVVVHGVASRSDAARLAPVVSALSSAGVPQSVARLVVNGTADADVFDARGVPRATSLIDLFPSKPMRHTADALTASEETLSELDPALLVLAGDSDAGLAFALAASKLGIPIARVGGGLRCGDFSLSEEINRTLGDRLADVIFTESREAADALEAEGISGDRVHVVGSTAVDLVRRCEEEARELAMWQRLGVPRGGYVLATFHRPERVVDEVWLARVADALVDLATRVPVVFPLHPSTRSMLERNGDVSRLLSAGVRVTTPLEYVEFVSLQQSAGAIVTDSGGVQDEASALGVPCYTLRRSTERVVTLTSGTNVLLGDDPGEIARIGLEFASPLAAAIPMWDGRAAERIAAVLGRRLITKSSS